MFGCNTLKKKRPMEYIWTLNGSVKIILKVLQTLASESINTFIADSCCALCKTSSRDNITNKSSTRVKIQHKKNNRCNFDVKTAEKEIMMYIKHIL